jgi:Cu-Zn family superoxide dismutase
MRQANWMIGALFLFGTARADKPPKPAATAPAKAEAKGAMAEAELKDAAGKKVGMAKIEEAPHGLVIDLELTGFPPGEHALHIHEVGKCEPPFKSAGGHFNPGHKHHGIKNAEGHHGGDLPNVIIPESGKTTVQVFAPGVTLHGEHGVFDADGSSLVLHAKTDDLMTDPAGNAGDRIACGVITEKK